MTQDKGILIRNIYHMLAYAFQDLSQNNYDKIKTEPFDNIQDLFAEILSIGIAFQLKQGLRKEYISKNESLNTLRGKLNIYGSVKNFIANKRKLDCDFDELSVNNLFNQILKTTAKILIKHGDVNKKRKDSLKKLMMFFAEVSTIDPSVIRWSAIRYDRNCKNYRMLHYICYFIIENWLLTTEQGNYIMKSFSDEKMSRLYEKFILEYYKRHHSKCNPSARQIKWNFDMEKVSAESLSVLPIMQSDIFLEINDRTLIIDAKYYSKSLMGHLGNNVLNSPNFYQINSYVLNHDRKHTGKVDGMLLYAQTQEDGKMDYKYPHQDGNVFYVKSLDLNQEFEVIKGQLDSIINSYLPSNT